MMQQSLSLPLLLAASLAALLVAADYDPGFQPTPEPFDDWKEDHYKVYAREQGAGDVLDPKMTLQLLKKLQNLYRDRNDEGSRGRFERVSILIDVSQISEEKCNQQSLEDLTRLVDKHSIFRVNLLAYLELHYKKQLAMCKDIIKKKVKKSLMQNGDAAQLLKYIKRNIRRTFNTPLMKYSTRPPTIARVDWERLTLDAQEQLRYCEDWLSQPTSRFSDHGYEYDVMDALNLSKNLTNSIKGSKYYNKHKDNQLVAGVLDFVEAQNGGSLERAIMMAEGNDIRSKIALLIGQTVENACDSLKSVVELCKSIDGHYPRNERLLKSVSYKRCTSIGEKVGEIAELAESTINDLLKPKDSSWASKLTRKLRLK